MTLQTFSRRELLGTFAASTAALALPGCAQKVASTTAPATPAALLDDIAWRLLDSGPEGATSLGIDTGAHAGLRARLGDRSAAGMASRAAQLRSDLARIEAVGEAGLDPATRTSLAVVRSAFGTALDGLALPYGDVAVGSWRNTPYVVVQNVGAYLDTPRFLDSDHPVKTPADAEAYLSRLAAMGDQLDGELGRLKSAGAMGLVAPSFLLDKTLVQLDRTIADAQGQNGQGGGLVTSLTRRATDIPGDWDRRARAIVTAKVLPTLERQRAELAAQRARASADAGLWARPRGDEFYAWALRASTTTRRTPDEVHALGLEQVAELHGRMDPILRGLGFTSGTVGARMLALGKDPRFKFSNDDKGRAEIIATMQRKLDYIRTRLPDAFRRLARGNLEIRRLPVAEEAGAPGAYGGAGSIDGTVPGKIWLNLGDTDRHSRYGLATLAFHEGIPGHVWQGEYANQLPLIRSVLAFNAYSEGWALYSETLGDELGAYDGDPVGRLGYLQSIAFRACRMVVDTGLHAKRWSRSQAIEWFSTTNGSGLSEVAPEVDRYCSWPGQACGYKMGHSEILRQRTRAQAALGARYDLRDFDQAVVDGGNVPLDVLADNVSRYIAGATG
ncbi:MAG TPA: DUF885 domain-containing protein [Novosphingobium sp.]|nr:DUF885 domain-containing protein [Novosphingobium sp.]